MRNKLEHTALPNLEEVKQFHAGTLSPSRMKEIRDIANENPLLKESLEGYAVTGAFVVMPAFETTGLSGLGANANAAAAAGSTVGSGSATTTWWASTKAILATLTTTKLVVSIGIVAAGTTAWWFKQSAHHPVANPTAAVEIPLDSSKALFAEPATNAMQNHDLAPMDQLQDVITGQGVGANANAVPGDAGTAFSDTEPRGQVEPISSIQTPNTLDNPEPNTPLNSGKKGIMAVSMTQILNYRVADYTDFRKPKWNNNVFSERHTPANLESHVQDQERPTHTDLNYLGFVESSLKYLDNKQHKQAKEGFDALLKLYPDDVNAQFYGAMARYANKEYEASLALFILAEKNSMRPFREDAKFYRAMALKNANRTEEANQLLDEIINAGGFYAKRAMTER